MSIIGPESENNPDRGQYSPDRVIRPEVVISQDSRRVGRHRTEDIGWLGLAGCVLRSWPMTLRLVLLLVIVLTCAAGAAVVLSIV